MIVGPMGSSAVVPEVNGWLLVLLRREDSFCRQDVSPLSGHFASWTFCPLDGSPLDDSPSARFAPGQFAPYTWTFHPLDVLPKTYGLGAFCPLDVNVQMDVLLHLRMFLLSRNGTY